MVMNLLELSEHEKLMKFHICSLEAYRAVSSHCNKNIAEKVGDILDPEQLLHCLKLRGTNFSLNAAYVDLFNALHLELEVRNTLITRGEFILPLSECHRSIPLFLPGAKSTPGSARARKLAPAPLCERGQALLNQAAICHSIISSFPKDKCGGDGCRFSFSIEELKKMVFYNLEKLLSTK